MTVSRPADAGSTVAPRYGTGSLSEVLPSALAAAGAPDIPNTLDLPEASAYVVLLVDGMGRELLRRHAGRTPFLSSLGTDRVLTCGVPSTTATSIASIGTGTPPGTHGLVGYTSRIPHSDDLLDALTWDSRVDPLTYQPHPTVFQRGTAAGIAMSVVSRRSFEQSGLTRATQRGARYVGADTRESRIEGAVDCARRPRSVTYVYEGRLDATGHKYGCGSREWRDELTVIDAFAEDLADALPTGAVLLVVADHGMVDVAHDARWDVDRHPDLMRDVRVFGGEARFRHLYCEEGAAGSVRDRWAATLGPDVVVLTRDDAIERGWFGPVEDRVRRRLGDVVVASVGDTAVVSTTLFPREAELVGLHGSLTAEEMLVPLLVAPA